MNNPMSRYAGTAPANPMRRYAKPQPGAANPERRYSGPPKPRPQTPRLPSGKGFMGGFRSMFDPAVESLGRQVGMAAGTAARVYPAARALSGAGNRLNLQSPAANRGKFLQRVYADQQMPKSDMPVLRAFTGQRSPFAKTHGAPAFDRAMKEFQRTHKWARETKNKTDVEFAVNYLLSKKHKGYYNP